MRSGLPHGRAGSALTLFADERVVTVVGVVGVTQAAWILATKASETPEGAHHCCTRTRGTRGHACPGVQCCPRQLVYLGQAVFKLTSSY